jgi:cyclic pyranopterin phosphate synthase
VVPLAEFCRAQGLELRFIEYMPLDGGEWERNKVLLAGEILDRLAAGIGPLAPVPDGDPSAPATDYRFADGKGRIGIIASVSRPFCRGCNRVRLTADGKLRNCLFALDETDIRALIRGGADDAALASALRQSVAGKWEGHAINSGHFIQPDRLMHSIGG